MMRARALAAQAQAQTDHAHLLAAHAKAQRDFEDELAAREKQHALIMAAKDAEIAGIKEALAKATLRRSLMSRAEKAAYQREHGSEAYQRLPD